MNLNYHTKNQHPAQNQTKEENLTKSTFNHDVYFEHHKADKFGNIIIHTEEIESTQIFCKENKLNELDGIVMLADIQTAGKGNYIFKK